MSSSAQAVAMASKQRAARRSPWMAEYMNWSGGPWTMPTRRRSRMNYSP